MTVNVSIQILVAFGLAVCIGMAFGLWRLRSEQSPNPRPPVNIQRKYDFRDDAYDLMQMLKRKYKSKDSQRKIRNMFVHIYNYYENRCKKCTK